MELDKRELDRVVAEGIGLYKEKKANAKFTDERPICKIDMNAKQSQPASSGKKKFKITVEGVQGTCVACHQAGQVFYMTDDKTPEGICLTAFSGLLPYLNAMICDAEFPWEDQKGRIRLGCPDPDNNVVFLIEELQ